VDSKAAALVLACSTVFGCGPGQPPASPATDASAAKSIDSDGRSELEAIATSVVQALAGGRASELSTRFDDAMREALPTSQLEQVWGQLEHKLGSFRSARSMRHQKVDAFRVVFVTMDFERGAMDLKLVFDEQQRVAGLFVTPPRRGSHPYEPPGYARMAALTESEITVGAGRWALPGTLTRPKASDTPCPAVLLVHGSGPNDRDETVGPNKAFRDLALGLASRGVCVLRYEKRTKEHARAVVSVYGDKLTLKEESVDDALAAAATLRATQGIDAKRIFVLGHSAGGTAVVRIARADAELRGFIVLAGSSQPLEDVVARQMRYIASLDGKLSDRERVIVERVDAQAARVKSLTVDSKVSAEQLPLGIPAAYWLDLTANPIARDLKEERRAMLVLHGDRDYQVTLDDFDGWKKALAGSQRARFKRYPKLNHMFMSGSGKSTPMEYQTPNHVAPEVIEDITRFIHES
jgi:dienelactone hydrolase